MGKQLNHLYPLENHKKSIYSVSKMWQNFVKKNLMKPPAMAQNEKRAQQHYCNWNQKIVKSNAVHYHSDIVNII